ncbi:MAG: tetratricopeptide repeat protein [Flavobacteriales bacterium]
MQLRLLFLAIVLVFAACKSKQVADGKTLKEEQELEFTHYFINANRDKVIGKFNEALAGFDKCIKIDPTCATCYYEIAGILETQRHVKEALNYARKAVELDGENKWFLFFYADLTRQNRLYDECILTYQKLIKLQPSHIENLYELAEVYIEAGKFENAIESYNKIEDRTGIREDLSVQKYKLYLKLNNNDKAVREMEKLIVAQPENTRVILMLADYLMMMGKEEEGVAKYESAIKINPKEPGAHLSLSDYYFKKGDKEKGFAHLTRAFENPSMNIDTKVQVLMNYYRISKNDSVTTARVFSLLEAMERAHPNDAQTYAIYGDFYYRDNIYGKALEKFRKARDLEPDKYLVWRNILAIDAETKEYQKLYDEATDALEYFPSQAELYWYKGIAGVQLKKYPEAIEALNDGVNLVAGNDALKSQFYSTLGDLYNETKEFVKSDENFEKALEYDANNVYVLNNYSYYLSLRKEKLARAEEMSKKSNILSPENASFEDTYGWILFQEGKYNDAVQWLTKAENHGGSGSGTILEHLGDTYFMMGDLVKAMAYWNKAKNTGNGVSSLIDRKISQQKYLE